MPPLVLFFPFIFIFIFFLFRLRAFRPSPHAGTVAITSTHCAAVIHAAACAAHWFEHNVLLPLMSILYCTNASHPTANLPRGRAIDPPTPPGTCRRHAVRNPCAEELPPRYGSPVVFFLFSKVISIPRPADSSDAHTRMDGGSACCCLWT